MADSEAERQRPTAAPGAAPLGGEHPRTPVSDARNRINADDTLDEWLDAVRDHLGLDATLDVDAVLDLARAAAHGVARPAAPLTTFLAGYALARGDRDAGTLLTELAAMADAWPADDE